MIRRGWFLILACAALVLVSGVLVLVHLRLRSADSRLPERGTRTTRIGNCPAEVEVIFDRQGSPHIRTDSQSAIWFAQGYVHARDRFFQMELARRTAAGTLAEVLGEDALENDRKIRILRLAATARRQVTQLRADHLAVLEWYAAGVNSALEEHGRWIAPEIWLLGFDPEPWRPVDSLTIGMLLQLDLSWAMGEELNRGLQLARLGRERALDLWGWTEREARAWIPPGKGVRHPFRSHEPITPPLAGFGSNAWAVAGERSASGRPLLATDPHLGVQMPGTFAAIHLDGADMHAAGLSVPGIPGVLIGHTEQVAWGLAVAMVDDQDLFILTLDDSGTRELVDGRWQPLRTVTEKIEVRWRENVELVKVRMSVHGPLVREQRDETLALSWSAHRGPSVLTAVLEMNRAQTADQAAAAWRGVSAPALHMVSADTAGTSFTGCSVRPHSGARVLDDSHLRGPTRDGRGLIWNPCPIFEPRIPRMVSSLRPTTMCSRRGTTPSASAIRESSPLRGGRAAFVRYWQAALTGPLVGASVSRVMWCRDGRLPCSDCCGRNLNAAMGPLQRF